MSSQPNPPPPSDLTEKSRWMLIIVKNQTQFDIIPNGPPYFDSGRYWSNPQAIERFSQMYFGVCNRDAAVAGATGGTPFTLRLDSGQSYDFAVVRDLNNIASSP